MKIMPKSKIYLSTVDEPQPPSRFRRFITNKFVRGATTAAVIVAVPASAPLVVNQFSSSDVSTNDPTPSAPQADPLAPVPLDETLAGSLLSTLADLQQADADLRTSMYELEIQNSLVPAEQQTPEFYGQQELAFAHLQQPVREIETNFNRQVFDGLVDAYVTRKTDSREFTATMVEVMGQADGFPNYSGGSSSAQPSLTESFLSLRQGAPMADLWRTLHNQSQGELADKLGEQLGSLSDDAAVTRAINLVTDLAGRGYNSGLQSFYSGLAQGSGSPQGDALVNRFERRISDLVIAGNGTTDFLADDLVGATSERAATSRSADDVRRARIAEAWRNGLQEGNRVPLADVAEDFPEIAPEPSEPSLPNSDTQPASFVPAAPTRDPLSL